jgi:hypothetical protein
MALLNGICACDSCGKNLKKGEGSLNNRKSKLYCENCWNKMKSYDPKGEELILGETWIAGVQRTNSFWA